jgi:hypothetical protein
MVKRRQVPHNRRSRQRPHQFRLRTKRSTDVLMLSKISDLAKSPNPEHRCCSSSSSPMTTPMMMSSCLPTNLISTCSIISNSIGVGTSEGSTMCNGSSLIPQESSGTSLALNRPRMTLLDCLLVNNNGLPYQKEYTKRTRLDFDALPWNEFEDSSFDSSSSLSPSLQKTHALLENFSRDVKRARSSLLNCYKPIPQFC